MKTKLKFKDFIFPFPQNKVTTLNQLSKLYVNKALRLFFVNHNIYKLKEDQLFGIIFKLKFEDVNNKDNDSIKAMSTMIRADKTSFIKLTTLFKHLLALRMNDYKDMKANQIIFTYHIFSEDYKDLKLDDNQRKEIISKNSLNLLKVDNNINYMSHNNLFKLPLNFATDIDFTKKLMELNSNISPFDNDSMKYKVLFNKINNQEVDVNFVLQSDNSISLYQFKDKLISIPKLNQAEILLERSFGSEIYLIDSINNEILLYKNKDANKNKGFIKKLDLNTKLSLNDLNKFITFDFETIKVTKNNNSFENIPILLGYHDHYNNISDHSFLFDRINDKNLDIVSNRKVLIKQFFEKFLTSKYNGFKFYAHNLSRFDAIFMLMNLVKMKDKMSIKIEPLFRDGRLITITVKYGYRATSHSYRYSIEFRDSLLLLLCPLSDLIKYFVKDPNLNIYKDNSKDIINGLIGNDAKILINNLEFRKKLIKYCINDCKSLSIIINKFSLLIFDLFKLNIHDYPTISSLAFAIYRTHFLMSDNLIPKITGQIYKDIKKAYSGGHVDVYKLYSNRPVHSYDAISLYPSEMFKMEFPAGKITHFIGNILSNRLNYSFEDLLKMKAFVKCDIYVDKSINRPVYQTHIMFNGQIRAMCATGTFLNQWIYIPELLKYQLLTNNKIRIIEDSIKEGYLFQSKPLFSKYVDTIFKLKNSVSKSDPLYLIAKILLNSLYGRLGLKPELQKHDFILNTNLESFVKGLNVIDIIKVSDKYSLVITEKGIDDGLILNSSVAIAAAVTSYGRMYMAPMLLDNKLDILYTDTDSAKSTNKITELEKYQYLNHNGLGGLKFEDTMIESIFLSPKLYGGINIDNDSITKVKGFKDRVEFEILKKVLFNKESITLNQEKWFKDFIKEEILIKNQDYTLALNENKRIINFNDFSTSPYHFENYDPEKL